MIYYLNSIDKDPVGFQIIIDLFISTRYFISDIILSLANNIHTIVNHFNKNRKNYDN